MKNFVLISKDAMCTDYLPIYGNKYWNTPNIDAIAKQGTVFKNHYTAAPSTVMSFYSMITGIYNHETQYEMYERINDLYSGETLFTKLKLKGYKCHIIWGDIWMVLPKYFNCYRNDVCIHMLSDFKQGVGAHYVHNGFLQPDSIKRDKTFSMVVEKLKDLLASKENMFIWVHFPHVINGEVAYGSDIELFDKYVGAIRKLVDDDNIAITADHGNMNGHKGKIGYGYDVYQPAIRVPMITPRINDLKEYTGNTSSVDLYTILFEKRILKHKFIYSDTAYRAQSHRKLAIIYEQYKYIYNKATGIEELYDLLNDPMEEFSLIDDYVYDVDRNLISPSRELYYYPNWNQLKSIREIMKLERDRVWKNGSLRFVIKSRLKEFIKPFYEILIRKKI